MTSAAGGIAWGGLRGRTHGLVVKSSCWPPVDQVGLTDRDRRHDVTHMIEHVAALIGQHHAAAVANEQPCTKFLLQHPHLPAERGLGDVHAVGGLAEAAGLGDMDESAELRDFHRAIQFENSWSHKIVQEVGVGDS